MGRYAQLLIDEAGAIPQTLLTENRFWTVEVFHELLLTISETIFTDPEHALEMARTGPELAAKIATDEQEFASLMTLALGRLGAALRANARYAEAEDIYLQALAQPAPPTILADIHSRRSHLKTTLGNPTEGVDCANKAIDLLKGLDSCIVDRHPIGLALIARAHAYYAAGATAAAIVDTSTAIAVLNPKKQPHHLFTAFHNLAVYLFEHKDSTPEQLEEAFRHLAIAHRGFRHYSRPHIAKCKLKWLQALIQIRLGAIHRAEENFRTARTGFIKLNAISEVAHISLDLGELLLREGNGKEARQLAFEAFKLGQAHGLHPGALAALKLWLKANDTASRIGSRKQLIHHLQPHGIKRLTA